ncbi:Creatinine amidohydrolase [Botrimarina colliarenosi]|uniref:Creatinine amidohydrolase n=1 Tax=Botrimarina colliarenosi TaxID=2528001 RepID=A0A5C6A6X1_9BACT|nr:creatininase family protein [Botrimarina colliarenosi]TWT95259.1 Creatinine amidohydrolase [Botrimarina colliarenosi]
MPIREHVLLETNYRRLRERPPRVAVLPWGATEAHNLHLPYGTDVLLATGFAEAATERAVAAGAAAVVLPTIPYGNDEQQLDQVCTISLTTTTALALLRDVVRSLAVQAIDRLVIVNAHGGNQFKPLVRDLQPEFGVLIVVADTFAMAPAVRDEVFEVAGDHADESETSLLLHTHPELVELDEAGEGARLPFAIEGLGQPGVWTPRPWSLCHPDTGSGDPSKATAEKGVRCFEAVVDALARVIGDLSAAEPGDLPYLGRDCLG